MSFALRLELLLSLAGCVLLLIGLTIIIALRRHRSSDSNVDMESRAESQPWRPSTIQSRSTPSLKREDSPILKGYQLYHNYFRPHMGLDGKTPAEAAGIRIEGENPWVTVIQNAKLNRAPSKGAPDASASVS